MQSTRYTMVGLVLSVLTVIALAGCTRVEALPGVEGGPGNRVAPAPAEPRYSCFSRPYRESVWEARRDAEGVQHPGREALLREIGEDSLEGWFLLEAGDERLAVARERDQAREPGDDILRTHDLVVVERFDGSWMLSQWSSCAPQRVLDGAAPAEVWIDGEPDPTATNLRLLVMELDCASGQTAEGRTRLVTLEERDDAVVLVVGVAPLGGAQSCPSNPATPMLVELDEPLGDRQIIDASVYSPRPLEQAPDGLR